MKFEQIDKDNSKLSTDTSPSGSDDSVEVKTTHKSHERLLKRQRIGDQKNIRSEYLSCDQLSSNCSKRLFPDDDTNLSGGEVAEGVAKLPDGGNPWDVDPQKRQYILVISHVRQDQEMNIEDFNDVYYEFSQCFKNVDKGMAKILSFLPNTPLLYEGRLYIMCNNEATSCWVRQQKFNGKWLVERFEVFHRLRKCRLVVPKIVKIKGMAEVLEIFEAQNFPLKTDLWVIRDCRKCRPDDDYTPTSFMGDHAIVDLLIDGDSELLLRSSNHQLTYCFSQIDVKMC